MGPEAVKIHVQNLLISTPWFRAWFFAVNFRGVSGPKFRESCSTWMHQESPAPRGELIPSPDNGFVRSEVLLDPLRLSGCPIRIKYLKQEQNQICSENNFIEILQNPGERDSDWITVFFTMNFRSDYLISVKSLHRQYRNRRPGFRCSCSSGSDDPEWASALLEGNVC